MPELDILQGARAQFKILSWSCGYLRGSFGS